MTSITGGVALQLGSEEEGFATIEALQERMEEVKAKVYAAVSAHYAEFLTTLNYTADLSADVAELAGKVEVMVDDATGAGLEGALDAAEGAGEDLARAEAVVGALRTLAGAHGDLEELEGSVAGGNYARAAGLVGELGAQLDELRLGEGSGLVDTRIFGILQAHYHRLAVQVEARVAELFKRGVRFDDPSALAAGKTPSPYSLTLTRRLTVVAGGSAADTPVSLSAVLDALSTLGHLDAKLEWVAAKLGQTLVDPIVKLKSDFTVVSQTAGVTSFLKGSLKSKTPRSSGGKAADPNVDANTDANNNNTSVDSAATPSGSPGTASEDAGAAIAHIGAVTTTVLDSLKAVIEFTASVLLNSNPEYVAVLGTFLWPRIVQGIIDDVLAPAVPTTAEELAAFTDVAAAVEAFELFALDTGLVSGASSELRDYVVNIDVHFAANKRRDLLGMARQILLANDQNTVQVTLESERSPFTKNVAKGDVKGGKGKGGKGGGAGGSGLFVYPTAIITVAAQTLVEMVWQTLTEAGESSAGTARQLFAGARDVFDLYRAIMPSFYGSRLENDERFAALFHNDCMYLAHAALTLGFEFKPALESLMPGELVTFVDLVPLFRSLGESVYASSVLRVRARIASTLAALEGLGGTHLDDRFDHVERTLQACTHIIQDMASVWQVFPSDLYFHSLGLVVDVVLSTFVSGVLALRDIAASESNQLVALMSMLTAPLDPLFTHGALSSSISVHAPSHAQFTALATLLASDLASITPESCAEFSLQNAQHLVRALFNDSSRRSAKLEQLSQAMA